LTLAHEPEKRPDLYTKAVECFEKAIQVYPQSFDGHYHLAYQLAEMREVTKAILAVKQSLSLESAHIPSWHLLVLLLSAQKEFDRALSICAIGLKESEWDLPQTDGLTASQLDGEEYLALRITQAALHDKIYGAESALEPQEALFALYTKVFAPEPASVGDSLYDIQNIRRRDQSDIELGSSATIVGRPRAGSILSVRSRSGASDIGHGLAAHNGSNLGMYMMASLLLLAILYLVFITHSSNSLFCIVLLQIYCFCRFSEIPKPNYASSITSIGSSGSKKNKKLIPPAAAASNVGSATLGKSLLVPPTTVLRPTTKSVQRVARANKVLASLWLLSSSTFRRLDRMEEALKAIEEAERIDASNPDVWYQVRALDTQPLTVGLRTPRALLLMLF